MPNLLSDLIKGIVVSGEDLLMVGESTKPAGMLRAAVAARADVIILGEKDVSIDKCRHVLYGRPRLRIIAISADGRRGSLHELRPRVRTIGDLSAESLIAAIRGAAGRGDGSAVPRE